MKSSVLGRAIHNNIFNIFIGLIDNRAYAAFDKALCIERDCNN